MNYLKLKPDYSAMQKRFEKAVSELFFDNIRTYSSLLSSREALAGRIRINMRTTHKEVIYDFNDVEQGNLLRIGTGIIQSDVGKFSVVVRPCQNEHQKKEYDILMKCLLEWVKGNTPLDTDKVKYIVDESNNNIIFPREGAIRVTVARIISDGFDLDLISFQARAGWAEPFATVKVRLKGDEVVTTVLRGNNRPYGGLYKFEIDAINNEIARNLLRYIIQETNENRYNTLLKLVKLLNLPGTDILDEEHAIWKQSRERFAKRGIQGYANSRDTAWTGPSVVRGGTMFRI